MLSCNSIIHNKTCLEHIKYYQQRRQPEEKQGSDVRLTSENIKMIHVCLKRKKIGSSSYKCCERCDSIFFAIRLPFCIQGILVCYPLFFSYHLNLIKDTDDAAQDSIENSALQLTTKGERDIRFKLQSLICLGFDILQMSISCMFPFIVSLYADRILLDTGYRNSIKQGSIILKCIQSIFF